MGTCGGVAIYINMLDEGVFGTSYKNADDLY